MAQWDDEKWLLEQNAAENFVQALNARSGTAYRVLLHSDRPDVVIEDVQSCHKIWVEVAHLFYDAEEARILLGRSDGRHSEENIKIYIYRLNQLLQQKSEKASGYSYAGDLALLIRVASPIFGVEDFNQYEKLIELPISPYTYIWLLFFDFASQKWDIIKHLS
ncbi:MAG: hypothetical protein M0Z55_00490 [Peptococcaceae bacterium]|nr:hypothetical protein [Peptococcaceae bacterium]